MDNNSKEYQELLVIWNKKLADSGFKDIAHDDNTLKHYGNTKSFSEELADSSARPLQDRQEYYRLVGHFLYDYKFASEKDKFIWQLYSEGLGAREIRDFDATIQLSKTSIDRVIQKHKKIMFSMYLGK